MDKKIIVIIAVAIMVAAVGTFVNEKIQEANAHSSKSTLYVGGTGSNNYSTIQEAIDAAADNFTIYIFEGIYDEHLIVPVEVTSTGASASGTIIEGGMTGTVLTATSDGLTITNLRFRYAGGKDGDALLYASTHSLSVQNCIFEYAYIVLSSGEDRMIRLMPNQ